MTRQFRNCWVAGMVTVVVLLATPTIHAEEPGTSPAAPAPTTQPAEVDPARRVTINREHRYVEMQATVIHREADWLELFACTPGGREHETIVTIAVPPREIHLALILIGLEPGHPLRWRQEGDTYVMDRPQGPKVRITVHYEKDGKQVETPASQWIIDRNTGKPMADEPWLFTGSRFATIEDRQVYVADLNGTTISLVNFGDDLLARDTTLTDRSDEERWASNTEVIPPVGTKVTVRLTAVKDDGPPNQSKPADDQPQS